MDISIHKLIIVRKIREPVPGGHNVPKKENIAYHLFIFKSKLSSKKKSLSHLLPAGIPRKRTPAQHMSRMNMCWLQVNEWAKTE
jgi:hypothetical protein